MSVPETEGSDALALLAGYFESLNEDKIAELYNEAMVDLDLANITQGEREILAIKLVDIRWEDQNESTIRFADKP